MQITKVINNRNTVFLTTKGLRTPTHIFQAVANDGETYTGMTKKDVNSHVNRINKLLVSNPELFKS